MDAISVVYVFGALITKHLICDFPLQISYHYRNKGTYGHPGGLAHAGIHMIGSCVALVAFVPSVTTLLFLMLADGGIHYHIDWAKMNINSHYGLRPDNSEQFWWLLGLDQWFHYMTYMFMVWYLV